VQGRVYQPAGKLRAAIFGHFSKSRRKALRGFELRASYFSAMQLENVFEARRVFLVGPRLPFSSFAACG